MALGRYATLARGLSAACPEHCRTVAGINEGHGRDINSLPGIERLPGWHGRYFHSQNMTFAHYDFSRGASIHEHFHPQEEVYELLEGELELTISGVVQIARPGIAAIVPSGAAHSVKALTDGRVLIVDYPRVSRAGVAKMLTHPCIGDRDSSYD